MKNENQSNLQTKQNKTEKNFYNYVDLQLLHNQKRRQ